VKQVDFCTKLNQPYKSDLYCWHTFLEDWNGISTNADDQVDATIQTDASDFWGCGAYFTMINGFSGNGQQNGYQYLSSPRKCLQL